MNLSTHRIYQCTQLDCRFRFPVIEREMASCPLCGAKLELHHHWTVPSEVDDHTASMIQKPSLVPQIEGLLDNVRSTYNVGSIFRTADAAGIQPLHLCGMTATPENAKVKKTALGTEQVIPWHYHTNSIDAAIKLKEAGKVLWALEKSPSSTSLFAVDCTEIKSPLVLIVGNERSGVDPMLIEDCDRVVHIPMQGGKRSLNVVVAFGIAAYFLRTSFSG